MIRDWGGLLDFAIRNAVVLRSVSVNLAELGRV